MIKKIIKKVEWFFYGFAVLFIKKYKVGNVLKDSFSIRVNSSHELRRGISFYRKEPEMFNGLVILGDTK